MTTSEATIPLHAGDVINEINSIPLVAPYVVKNDCKATIKTNGDTVELFVHGVCVAKVVVA